VLAFRPSRRAREYLQCSTLRHGKFQLANGQSICRPLRYIVHGCAPISWAEYSHTPFFSLETVCQDQQSRGDVRRESQSHYSEKHNIIKETVEDSHDPVALPQIVGWAIWKCVMDLYA
jgi:hypothetical protein